MTHLIYECVIFCISEQGVFSPARVYIREGGYLHEDRFRADRDYA